MAAGWTATTQAEMTALAFDERFALLVDAEWRARENKRLTRALQDAKLKLSQACLEAIDYPARRELDKAVIRQLATCRWVAEHHSVLITGMTGTGKSFLACALAHQACRKALPRPLSARLPSLPRAHPRPRRWQLHPPPRQARAPGRATHR
jgi:DNA replication protein DnaC